MKFIFGFSLLFAITICSNVNTSVELIGPNVCNRSEDHNHPVVATEPQTYQLNLSPDYYKKQNVPKSRVIKECCAGYGKNKKGDQCIAICTKCKHDECVAPEVCRCEAGGAECDIKSKCSPDRFGLNCTEICRCKNGGECRHISGECTCAAGFSGALCEESCPAGENEQECGQKCMCQNGKCDCSLGWMREKEELCVILSLLFIGVIMFVSLYYLHRICDNLKTIADVELSANPETQPGCHRFDSRIYVHHPTRSRDGSHVYEEIEIKEYKLPDEYDHLDDSIPVNSMKSHYHRLYITQEGTAVKE